MNTTNTNTEAADHELGTGSLLRPEEFGPLSSRYRRGAGDTLRAIGDAIRRASENKTNRRFAALVAVILAVGLSVWTYLEFWPRAIPNYAEADIEDVLDYTLLTDDFNRLPIDQRLALMKELVDRLKSMSAGDSEMMAAFAAGITGKAREQLRENAERLAVDLWDSYAKKYSGVPTEKRSDYLDNAFIEFTKLMEDVAGVESDKTDNERLGDARKQAKRDSDRAKENLGPVDGKRVGRVMKLVNDRGDKLASPKQQAQMGRFTRDMVRHLRGQDIDTGKPKDTGDGAPNPEAPAPPEGGG